ncbi:hypothetical protein COU57_04860 [Candidatus Pacearchaeota archaeon CG10_big_fil_rev_8_21_14_0_10_32_14]|nr:MAG: hypothetical protein COU57_04860 [Candidatus Pacearchaeota archaeon CG10_big_fil_rev_8_21_14_0_10_32_14]
MHQKESLYAFDGLCMAQDYEEGKELPILSFNELSRTEVLRVYKVVYDGELRDDRGEVMGRRKLWNLVSPSP